MTDTGEPKRPSKEIVEALNKVAEAWKSLRVGGKTTALAGEIKKLKKNSSRRLVRQIFCLEVEEGREVGNADDVMIFVRGYFILPLARLSHQALNRFRKCATKLD